MKSEKEIIGSNIKRLREHYGISLSMLSTMTGIPVRTLKSYEDAKIKPEEKTLEKISYALNFDGKNIDLTKDTLDPIKIVINTISSTLFQALKNLTTLELIVIKEAIEKEVNGRFRGVMKSMLDEVEKYD